MAQHEVVVCSHHGLGTRDRIAGKRRQTLDYLVEEGYTLLVTGIDGSSQRSTNDPLISGDSFGATTSLPLPVHTLSAQTFSRPMDPSGPKRASCRARTLDGLCVRSAMGARSSRYVIGRSRSTTLPACLPMTSPGPRPGGRAAWDPDRAGGGPQLHTLVSTACVTARSAARPRRRRETRDGRNPVRSRPSTWTPKGETESLMEPTGFAADHSVPPCTPAKR